MPKTALMFEKPKKCYQCPFYSSGECNALCIELDVDAMRDVAEWCPLPTISDDMAEDMKEWEFTF